MTMPVNNWGRLPHAAQNRRPARAHSPLDFKHALDGAPTLLPHGMGRSYGDVGLNPDGTLLQMTARDHIISFDKDSGILRARSGLTLDALLRVSVPQGWFIPVSPGSKFVTLGGAIANDVHGKNHHKDGSFGAHVLALSLVRSDRAPMVCTPTKNKKMFALTIGGLGLTGIIDWVELKLKPIKSAYLDVENIPYRSLDEFFKLSADSADWPYNVAWVDCFAPQSKLGRGIFTRARFSDYGGLSPHDSETKFRWPFPTPAFLLNRFTIGLFNTLYRIRPGARYKGRAHYDPYFYPLDSIADWNKLYGRKGFYQHQCLIPQDCAQDGIREMLSIIKHSGQGSFLAVLKHHGTEPSPGVMSFCNIGPGVSLALDFANKGEKTRALLTKLDDCVARHGGRNYIAKDAHMSGKFFQDSYPDWSTLEAARDPKIMSSFWQRVIETPSQNSTPKAPAS
ncbi:FAD-dependent oxidoreductase [Fretibacter rubidus]|uniref:FAD-binding oxidoreductase n=1 Tax=Fretibacter rubidus TaxID=570162 RepID=UPI00352A8763